MHWSDCSVNNSPAYEPGPCDCGWELAIVRARIKELNVISWKLEARIFKLGREEETVKARLSEIQQEKWD